MELNKDLFIKVGFNLRPYWKELLLYLKDKAELMLFTASSQRYADSIVDYMDPKREIFKYRFYRKNCLQTHDNTYIKDLRIFQNRNLKDIILVDNASYSFANQPTNGVPIFPFSSDYQDRELVDLQAYLDLLLRSDDVR